MAKIKKAQADLRFAHFYCKNLTDFNLDYDDFCSDNWVNLYGEKVEFYLG